MSTTVPRMCQRWSEQTCLEHNAYQWPDNTRAATLLIFLRTWPMTHDISSKVHHRFPSTHHKGSRHMVQGGPDARAPEPASPEELTTWCQLPHWWLRKAKGFTLSSGMKYRRHNIEAFSSFIVLQINPLPSSAPIKMKIVRKRFFFF